VLTAPLQGWWHTPQHPALSRRDAPCNDEFKKNRILHCQLQSEGCTCRLSAACMEPLAQQSEHDLKSSPCSSLVLAAARPCSSMQSRHIAIRALLLRSPRLRFGRQRILVASGHMRVRSPPHLWCLSMPALANSAIAWALGFASSSCRFLHGHTGSLHRKFEHDVQL
jgi:hypothetical protein